MRLILAAVIGAVILFAWSFVSWQLLGLHDTSGGTLPNEAAVTEALSEVSDSGTYWIPGISREDTKDAEKLDGWKERHRAGPIGFIVYHRDGREPMPPAVFAVGFGINFAAALLAAFLLAAAGIRSALGRLLFVASLGLFVSITSELVAWNWMFFHVDWITANIIDHLVGWGLTGVAMAAIVKPRAAG